MCSSIESDKLPVKSDKVLVKSYDVLMKFGNVQLKSKSKGSLVMTQGCLTTFKLRERVFRNKH